MYFEKLKHQLNVNLDIIKRDTDRLNEDSSSEIESLFSDLGAESLVIFGNLEA